MKGPTKLSPVQQVLDRLQNVKPNGNGWTALCPAHDDHRPSLSVAKGDDRRVLLNCHTGCETKEIVAALGLSLKDLFHDTRKNAAAEAHKGAGLTLRKYAIAKKLPGRLLAKHGLGT